MSTASADRGLALLREAGRVTRFHEEQFLITAGDPSTHVLLVESGLVRIMLLAEDGPAVLAAIVGRGELIGESGVIHQTRRSAQVTAVTPGTATVLGGPEFLRLLDRHAAVRDLVGAATRRRQERSDNRHLALARDVPSRVAATLLDWARSHGVTDGRGLRLNGPTQRDVAMAVSASEKSVEAIYKRLRDVKLLATGRRSYRLPDLDAIAAIASGERLPAPDIRE